MSKKFPTLYGISKQNKIKIWNISVENNTINKTAIIHTDSGYEDQKIKRVSKVIYEGKNTGKINETTPYTQALSEAESTWKRKKDQNYQEVKPDLNNYIPNKILPMLAQPPGKGKIVFPCYIQPKLNGICCLSRIEGEKVIYHSRGGKEFQFLDHLDPFIKLINSSFPLHGELYTHGWSLQKIGSYTKERKMDHYNLGYWIYDVANPIDMFSERWKWFENQFVKYSNKKVGVRITPTYIVNNRDEVKKYHDDFVSQGFEGAILKNMHGLYIYQYRSNDIEKVKEFQDAEFLIIGGKQGTGLDEGCIIFRCITKDAKEFDVRPRGTVEERKEMFSNLNSYLGKMLTIRFPEYTDEGKPSQPVGICVRDYE